MRSMPRTVEEEEKLDPKYKVRACTETEIVLFLTLLSIGVDDIHLVIITD